MSLEDWFYDVDDFCRLFLPDWHCQQLQYGERQRCHDSRLVLSEIMTILIHFHQSHYRDFKAFCWLHVCRHLADAFPNWLSYTRFVALIPTALVPLCVYLQARKGQATGIAFIDATSLVGSGLMHEIPLFQVNQHVTSSKAILEVGIRH